MPTMVKEQATSLSTMLSANASPAQTSPAYHCSGGHHHAPSVSPVWVRRAPAWLIVVAPCSVSAGPGEASHTSSEASVADGPLAYRVALVVSGDVRLAHMLALACGLP